jgi:hypothetical protein
LSAKTCTKPPEAEVKKLSRATEGTLHKIRTQDGLVARMCPVHMFSTVALEESESIKARTLPL